MIGWMIKALISESQGAQTIQAFIKDIFQSPCGTQTVSIHHPEISPTLVINPHLIRVHAELNYSQTLHNLILYIYRTQFESLSMHVTDESNTYLSEQKVQKVSCFKAFQALGICLWRVKWCSMLSLHKRKHQSQ